MQTNNPFKVHSRLRSFKVSFCNFLLQICSFNPRGLHTKSLHKNSLFINQTHMHPQSSIFNIAQAWLPTFSYPNREDPCQESKKNRKCSYKILNICLKRQTKTCEKTFQNSDHETDKILGICTRTETL